MEIQREIYSNTTQSSNDIENKEMKKLNLLKKIRFTPFDNSSRSQHYCNDSDISMLKSQEDEIFENSNQEYSTNVNYITEYYQHSLASATCKYSLQSKVYGIKSKQYQETGANNNSQKKPNKLTTFTDFLSHVNKSKLKKLCSPKNKQTDSFISLYQEKIRSLLSINHTSSLLKNNQIFFPYANQVGLKTGQKRILFFEIDKVLMKCSFGGDYLESDEVIEVKLLSCISVKVGKTLRPMIRETLKKLQKHYFLCIYSTCDEILGEALINFLDLDNKLFILRLYRNKCHKFKVCKHHVYVKDLRIIKDISVKDILIIDTNSLSDGLQPQNVLLINSFFCTKKQTDLSYLVPQLELLFDKDDISISNGNCMQLRRKKSSTVKLSNCPISEKNR